MTVILVILFIVLIFILTLILNELISIKKIFTIAFLETDHDSEMNKETPQTPEE